MIAYPPLVEFCPPTIQLKSSDGTIRTIDGQHFATTGIVPQFEDALRQAKQYGPNSLGTIGYFYDEQGYLRESSDIVQFMDKEVKPKSIGWDSFFMSLAYFVAMKSKDPSSRIGAVIVGEDNEVISLGYNGLPRGLNDCCAEREERPLKYSFYEHGERNAIYNAARIGVTTKRSRLYTQGTPCVDCARAIIQAGIQEVVVDARWEENPFTGNNRTKWLESSKISCVMFQEAGVNLRVYRGELISAIEGLFSGHKLNLSNNE